jgi:hypothetical protein
MDASNKNSQKEYMTNDMPRKLVKNKKYKV